MSHSYSGVIRYTSQQHGRIGQARGREQFVITLNDDGSRSLRSHVIIQDPPMVERDVVLSVDSSFHPRSAQVRIRVGDDREGQALLFVMSTVFMARVGRLRGRIFRTAGRVTRQPLFL